MGPRVALANVLEPAAVLTILDFVDAELVPFPFSRGGLDAKLTNAVQKNIFEFAAQPHVPPVPDWIWNPPIDVESLREFGEWCRDGCPVTVGSETYRYRYGNHASTASSSATWERQVHFI